MKRGELDHILDASQVVSVTSVAFCGCPDDHRVLEANYWGPRRKHAEHGLQLWICAVSSQERHVVHDTQNGYLPVDWRECWRGRILRVVASDTVSRRKPFGKRLIDYRVALRHMGTWGVALFSDDLAADLRGDFRELIGDGLTASQAVEKLMGEFASSLDDDDEMPVFWLALAAVQWQLGRVEEGTKQNAIQIIDSGRDLQRWDVPSDRDKRAKVLNRLKVKLLSPPPLPKRVPRTVKSTNDWLVGEVIAFRLTSGNWTLMRVIGHHSDKGGRFAICELLDWVGDTIPSLEAIKGLSVRTEASPRGISQFFFQEPRKKKDIARVLRTGFNSDPSQKPGEYTGLVWPYTDRLLKDIFGVE
ncbi:MAG: hypothetical protein ABSG53_14655 [Thermoguttaceae bacterium]